MISKGSHPIWRTMAQIQSILGLTLILLRLLLITDLQSGNLYSKVRGESSCDLSEQLSTAFQSLQHFDLTKFLTRFADLFGIFELRDFSEEWEL
jgi:hypothetical protein